MKFVKVTLSDKNVYTFSTFTLLEQRVMKTEHAKYLKLQDEINKIQFEVDENGKLKKDENKDVIIKENISDAEREKLDKLQNEMFDFMIDILRKSISRNHPEFKKVDDVEGDKKIREKLMDMVDTEDLRLITQFAFTGLLPDYGKIEFDLTEDTKEEKKS